MPTPREAHWKWTATAAVTVKLAGDINSREPMTGDINSWD
jgi:hypothetical protein